MLIAKVIDKGGAKFYEVQRIGRVLFDDRDDWFLCASPVGARPRKQELRWMHPRDVSFEWVRNFRFADGSS